MGEISDLESQKRSKSERLNLLDLSSLSPPAASQNLEPAKLLFEQAVSSSCDRETIVQTVALEHSRYINQVRAGIADSSITKDSATDTSSLIERILTGRVESRHSLNLAQGAVGSSAQQIDPLSFELAMAELVGVKVQKKDVLQFIDLKYGVALVLEPDAFMRVVGDRNQRTRGTLLNNNKMPETTRNRVAIIRAQSYSLQDSLTTEVIAHEASHLFFTEFAARYPAFDLTDFHQRIIDALTNDQTHGGCSCTKSEIASSIMQIYQQAIDELIAYRIDPGLEFVYPGALGLNNIPQLVATTLSSLRRSNLQRQHKETCRSYLYYNVRRLLDNVTSFQIETIETSDPALVLFNKWIQSPLGLHSLSKPKEDYCVQKFSAAVALLEPSKLVVLNEQAALDEIPPNEIGLALRLAAMRSKGHTKVKLFQLYQQHQSRLSR